MNRAIRLACMIALPLAVSACGEKEPDDKASAAGEILPGSISDAMLPLDSVRSEPPLMPRKSATKAGEAEDEDDAEAEALEEAGAAAEAAATPASTPTVTTTPSPTAPAAQQ